MTMKNDDYVRVQEQLILLVDLVTTSLTREDLGEFMESIERADSIGPLLDPTLWIRGHETMYRIRDLAAAALVFVSEAKRFKEASAAKAAAAAPAGG